MLAILFVGLGIDAAGEDSGDPEIDICTTESIIQPHNNLLHKLVGRTNKGKPDLCNGRLI
jgi:hypothetical protein